MPIRIRHKVYVQASRDIDGKQKLFYPDAALSEVVIDTFQKSASGNLEIPVATTEQVSFGDVDNVKGIFLEVDSDCYVRINGSLDNIAVLKAGVNAKLFLEADINQVQIENYSPDDVLTGVYCCWGDPTP